MEKDLKITDLDIATVEALHDILVDHHGHTLGFPLLKRARVLITKLYKLEKLNR